MFPRTDSISPCATSRAARAATTATTAASALRAPSHWPQPPASTPPPPPSPIGAWSMAGWTSEFKGHRHDRDTSQFDDQHRDDPGRDEAAVEQFLDLPHPADNAVEEPGPHQPDGFQCFHPAIGDVQP